MLQEFGAKYTKIYLEIKNIMHINLGNEAFF